MFHRNEDTLSCHVFSVSKVQEFTHHQLTDDVIDLVWVCCACQVNIYKDPVTDPGKKSKKGRLSLELDQHRKFYTSTENVSESVTVSLARPVVINTVVINTVVTRECFF